jgi:methylmalonyl-CoA mutase C-terminal domain/subunit
VRKIPGNRRRILLTKVGLDGHDRGVKIIARYLRDCGHEVIYMGRRQAAAAVAQAAIQEDVDLVGLSVLSGTHVAAARELLAALRESGCNVPLIMGGTVLRREIPSLKAMGVAEVFPVGTPLRQIREYVDSMDWPAGGGERVTSLSS